MCRTNKAFIFPSPSRFLLRGKTDLQKNAASGTRMSNFPLPLGGDDDNNLGESFSWDEKNLGRFLLKS